MEDSAYDWFSHVQLLQCPKVMWTPYATFSEDFQQGKSMEKLILFNNCGRKAVKSGVTHLMPIS